MIRRWSFLQKFGVPVVEHDSLPTIAAGFRDCKKLLEVVKVSEVLLFGTPIEQADDSGAILPNARPGRIADNFSPKKHRPPREGQKQKPIITLHARPVATTKKKSAGIS
jgi:hypothetical protein